MPVTDIALNSFLTIAGIFQGLFFKVNVILNYREMHIP